MDGRISAGICVAALVLSSSGCITTPTKKDAGMPSTLSTTASSDMAPTDKARREEAPKRNPLPRTEIAYGQLKEAEADSETARDNPEEQARLRDEARLAYQHAIKIDPNCNDAYRFLARVYGKIGDYERALDTYKKAMAKHPKDATLWYELGLCHNRRKDFTESTRCFQKALEIDPENREYTRTLGFTLAYDGKIDQGLTCLKRVHGPGLAHYNIARVMLQQERPDQAQHHLRLALRADSRLEQARELLASLETPKTASTQRTLPGS